MNAASAPPAAIGRWNTSTISAPNTTAAIAARLSDPRQVGGLSSRCVRCWRAIFLASSRVLGRPVLPARSIVPAGVPRCLRVRFFFVCAIPPTLPEGPERGFEQVALGQEAAQRHVLREPRERRLRREAHQLGLG